MKKTKLVTLYLDSETYDFCRGVAHLANLSIEDIIRTLIAVEMYRRGK